MYSVSSAKQFAHVPDQNELRRTNVVRTFYRIVSTDPPSEKDFRSHEMLGIPLIDPSKREQWSGISVYGTLVQARKKARQYPSKGNLIAELEINEDSDIRFARTGSARSHYTPYGTIDDLLRCVVAVLPVTEDEQDVWNIRDLRR